MEKKENSNTLLVVILTAVLCLSIGINIGWLIGQGYETEQVSQWFKDLAQGRDPRETLTASEVEKFLQKISE